MKFKAEVLITPRMGVLDTQGKAVQKTLINLGYKTIDEVRVGRIVTMDVDAASEDEARKLIASMCQDLLCNDLVETSSIKLEAAGR